MKQLFKKIYSVIPFKRELYTLLKTFWKPGEKIYQHLHFNEPFDVIIDDKRKFKLYNGTFIENEIFWEGLTGKWEKESMKIWLQLCMISDSVFDIGANTGVYSLVAKAVNPHASVYAFEPHPYFYQKLQKNILLNKFNIHAYQKAVSDFNGPLTIEDYSGNTQNISVTSISLDNFIEQNKITKTDLFKIDVETHEPQVLAGFRKYLSIYKPTMLIEILNTEVAGKVNDMVENLGYLYFNIDERGPVRQTEKIEQSNYYNYLLCSSEIAQKLKLT